MKDQRYTAIKSLIETNRIGKFSDIFTIVPVSVVKEDMGVNYNTLRRRISYLELLTVKDLITMAELFEVEPTSLLKLVQNEIKGRSIKKRK